MSQPDEKARVNVSIFGQKYTIVGDSTEEHIKEVATEVDRLIEQIRYKYPNISPGRVAVLAAVNLADELHKLKQDYQSLIDIIEESKEEQ